MLVKEKPADEMIGSLVGSEMCIRARRLCCLVAVERPNQIEPDAFLLFEHGGAGKRSTLDLAWLGTHELEPHDAARMGIPGR